MEENKQITLRINQKVILFFFISNVLAFIVVYLLQFNKEVNCGLLFPRTQYDDSQVLDEYHIRLNEYLEKVEQRLNSYDKSKSDQMAAYMQEFARYMPLKVAADSRDPYAALKAFSYDPCETQSYTQDFETFFGNKVKSDRLKHEENTSLGFMTEEQMKALKSPNTIVYLDKYAELGSSYGSDSPPTINIHGKAKVFNSKFSSCDCNSTSHKANVRLKGMLRDFIPALIIGIILTIVLVFVWKYNFKIKVTK